MSTLFFSSYQSFHPRFAIDETDVSVRQGGVSSYVPLAVLKDGLFVDRVVGFLPYLFKDIRLEQHPVAQILGFRQGHEAGSPTDSTECARSWLG